ncbi:MAG: penicillin-binding protein [Lachnospiraceae bacterium]|nr:penicillin-binding protein [Lachnospiraceae bacterium]
MFRNFREAFINMVTSRLFVLVLLFFALAGILIQRIFVLQIVEGEEKQEQFQLKTDKTISIPATRGNIYDRNGELLAYNELAYSVTFTDTLESKTGKNTRLNETLLKLIRIIEENGDSIVNDFNIIVNSEGEFEFAVSGTKLLRFLGDVFGKADTSKLEYAQKTATAKEVIDYLAGSKKYEIGEYADKEKKDFQVGKGYTNEELLKLVTLRYALGLNVYTQFIPTLVAEDVSDETVAAVMENEDLLEGVEIEETTIRRYVDSVYFSHILGYTGKISEDEYQELSAQNEEYTRNDVVGKAGIEQVMELSLQGKSGKRNVCVDNLGKIVEVKSQTNPVAGNDLYLTIDKNLQKVVYCLLEQKIAGILVDKIANVKEYIPKENASASDIIIPIDDVYYALINNSIIDISHFSEENAKETEQSVYQAFLTKQEQVIAGIREELTSLSTIYESLPTEQQAYQLYIVSMLEENGVLIKEEIDKENEVYLGWKKEKVSLKEYLTESIARNWIDITKLKLESKYSDADEVYEKLLDYIEEDLKTNMKFFKKVYKYMIQENSLSGRDVCLLLFEQKIIDGTDEDKEAVSTGRISPYTFMLDKIKNLDITPAQLALDPCSGSMVVTNVNTGQVLALVSYPSYDNNRLANTIDAEYYAQIYNDLSNPMWDYATQQLSAPGSTYKMITSVAALEEGVVGRGETVNCLGTWDTLSSTRPPKCWISPGRHGALNIEGAIENSCNYFFYEMGYRLSRLNGNYDSDTGLLKLRKYSEMFGLSDKSGVEIPEEAPSISNQDSVRSAIGQGNNNYSTAGLVRYVTTVANSGTCYNLSLLDKLTDSNGNLIEDFSPEIRNKVDISQSTWNAVHTGMRKVIEAKSYFQDMTVSVAGKTGTAQFITSRPNHALFVCYAPYENPEIAIATRIVYGYAADNAGQVTADVIKYYFGLEKEEDLLTGTAEENTAVNSREQ